MPTQKQRALTLRQLADYVPHGVKPVLKRLHTPEAPYIISDESLAWCEQHHWGDDFELRHNAPETLAPSITNVRVQWALDSDALLPVILRRVWEVPEGHALFTESVWNAPGANMSAGVPFWAVLDGRPPDWETWAVAMLLPRRNHSTSTLWLPRLRERFKQNMSIMPIEGEVQGQTRKFRVYFKDMIAQALKETAVWRQHKPLIQFTTTGAEDFDCEPTMPADLQALLRTMNETFVTMLKWSVAQEEWRTLFRLSPSVDAIKFIWPGAGLLAQLVLRSTSHFRNFHDEGRVCARFVQLRDTTLTARRQQSLAKNTEVSKLMALLTPEQWEQRRAMWNTLLVQELMQPTEGAE